MAENDAGANEEAPKKSKKTLIIIIAAVVLVLGGGGGAYFFLLSPPPEELAEGATPVVAAPTGPMIYLDMTPSFIVSYPFQEVAESPSSGIEQLRNLATEEVKAVLHHEIGRDGIEEVLFTSFVTQ